MAVAALKATRATTRVLIVLENMVVPWLLGDGIEYEGVNG